MRPCRVVLCALATVAILQLVGCAATVEASPAQFSPQASGLPAQRISLNRPATITLATGYGRELSAGSHWQHVGNLPQGGVYKPLNTVFSIEGRHVHEAWLVINNGSLQGFYLPAESRYSPLVPSLPLSLGAVP